jgi:hypothetical protein
VSDGRRRVRLWIAIVAALVALGLFALRQAGVEQALLNVLAISGGVLVTVLFVTYRALVNIVEMAKANPNPPPPDDDEDDE